jgi:ribosomal protein L11 methyltransferase
MAVTFADADDRERAPVLEPAPGEFRLWPAARISALFAAEADAAAITRELSDSLGLEPGVLRWREVADRAWEREWLRDFHAMRFGSRLWICPHHERVDDPQAAVVRMDPGLAFGTGTHPTTALCLEWLDAHPPTGAAVVDFGCGSGVLALAALRLGARSAAIPREADLLLANILSGPLVQLAPCFADILRLSGQLVLSGLMEQEAAEVTRAYEPWFDMRAFGVRDSWVCLWGRRNGRPRD